MPIAFSRHWGMPSADTFDCEPIKGFVQKYLLKSKVSVDPFARNKRWATYTNDLNPATAAQEHLEAEAFLIKLQRQKVMADLFIFDPPYSPRQLKECYDGIGKQMQMEDGQTMRLRAMWRDAALPILSKDAVVLSFGWNTVGFGKNAGFEIMEILIVCHGSDHNDTICMAERRILDRNGKLNLQFPAPALSYAHGMLTIPAATDSACGGPTEGGGRRHLLAGD